jgi:NADH:ubiquinone oxidoreductase subunit 6 (subunit J)
MSAMLFNQYLLPFEVTSILLLVAMLGAIILTLREKPKKEGGAQDGAG